MLMNEVPDSNCMSGFAAEYPRLRAQCHHRTPMPTPAHALEQAPRSHTAETGVPSCVFGAACDIDWGALGTNLQHQSHPVSPATHTHTHAHTHTHTHTITRSDDGSVAVPRNTGARHVLRRSTQRSRVY